MKLLVFHSFTDDQRLRLYLSNIFMFSMGLFIMQLSMNKNIHIDIINQILTHTLSLNIERIFSTR